jgi:hypothetical protein
VQLSEGAQEARGMRSGSPNPVIIAMTSVGAAERSTAQDYRRLCLLHLALETAQRGRS